MMHTDYVSTSNQTTANDSTTTNLTLRDVNQEKWVMVKAAATLANQPLTEFVVNAAHVAALAEIQKHGGAR